MKSIINIMLFLLLNSSIFTNPLSFFKFYFNKHIPIAFHHKWLLEINSSALETNNEINNLINIYQQNFYTQESFFLYGKKFPIIQPSYPFKNCKREIVYYIDLLNRIDILNNNFSCKIDFTKESIKINIFKNLKKRKLITKNYNLRTFYHKWYNIIIIFSNLENNTLLDISDQNNNLLYDLYQKTLLILEDQNLGKENILLNKLEEYLNENIKKEYISFYYNNLLITSHFNRDINKVIIEQFKGCKNYWQNNPYIEKSSISELEKIITILEKNNQPYYSYMYFTKFIKNYCIDIYDLKLNYNDSEFQNFINNFLRLWYQQSFFQDRLEAIGKIANSTSP